MPRKREIAFGHHKPYKFPSEINGVNIIEHIPFEPKAKRYAIIECPSCKNHVKKRYDAIKDHPLCVPCRINITAKKNTTHGMSKHPLFTRWMDMIARCYGTNETYRYYKFYQGAGVTVCDEWRNSFVNFYEWAIENGYEAGLEIDKDILCDELGISPKIYSPKTCKFVTPERNKEYARTKK